MTTDYLDYWSLRHRPFLEQPFFHGTSQREVIAGIAFFVASHSRFAQIVAPAGCGATTLLQHVASMQGLGDCAIDTVMSDASAWDGCDLTSHLALALGLHCDTGIECIRRMLRKNLQCGVKNLWLIDGAKSGLNDRLRTWSATCEELSILTVQGTQRASWNSDGDPHRIDLHPLTLEDTLQYVERALRHAAGAPSILTDGAVVRLHELSQGRIAVMATIGEHALLDAAAVRERRVASERIDQTAARLGSSEQVAAAA